jgi:hypothetical protein
VLELQCAAPVAAPAPLHLCICCCCCCGVVVVGSGAIYLGPFSFLIWEIYGAKRFLKGPALAVAMCPFHDLGDLGPSVTLLNRGGSCGQNLHQTPTWPESHDSLFLSAVHVLNFRFFCCRPCPSMFDILTEISHFYFSRPRARCKCSGLPGPMSRWTDAWKIEHGK